MSNSEVPDDWNIDRKAPLVKLDFSGSWNEQISSHSRTETTTARDISHCVDDVMQYNKIN